MKYTVILYRFELFVIALIVFWYRGYARGVVFTLYAIAAK